MDAKHDPVDRAANTERLRAQLETELGTCHYSDLQAHVDRDAVVIVSDEIKLVEAGLAVAEDDAESVGYWISQGKFAKPSANQLEEWKTKPLARFLSLIVRPYVLIQVLPAKAQATSTESPAGSSEPDN